MLEEVRAIAARAMSLPASRPVTVCIDGFCGAGKTTIADGLASALSGADRQVIRVSADDYQNPPEIRWQLGRNSAEGFFRHTIDVPALLEHLLEPMRGPGTYRYRTSVYDIRRTRPDLSPVFEADRDSILLVDGLFLFIGQLIRYWDLAVFVDTTVETCIARAKLRNQEGLANADAVEARYRARYVPGYRMYLEQVDPKAIADFVVSNEADAG